MNEHTAKQIWIRAGCRQELDPEEIKKLAIAYIDAAKESQKLYKLCRALIVAIFFLCLMILALAKAEFNL